MDNFSKSAFYIGTTAASVFFMRALFRYLDSELSEECPEQILRAQENWHQRHGESSPFPALNQYEQVLMKDMVFSDQITTSFDDIGGLSAHKESLWETVLFPLTQPHVYQQAFSQNDESMSSHINHILAPPLGVLFYGPPGCGKTLMAKAIAREAGCTFINCNVASLYSKYYGETEKFVSALFSLARKFSPCIIFVDEIDMYLGKRQDSERGVDNRLKAQFLTLWDGLTTNFDQHVIVLGATNRPYDLDEAITRRFGKQLLFTLPSSSEREHILEVLLHSITLDKDVLSYVVSRTEGYSGSDLKELCKRAAIEAFREHINKHRIYQTEKQQYEQYYDVTLNDDGTVVSNVYDTNIMLDNNNNNNNEDSNTISSNTPSNVTTNAGQSSWNVFSPSYWFGLTPTVAQKQVYTPQISLKPPVNGTNRGKKTTHGAKKPSSIPVHPGNKPRVTTKSDFDIALSEVLPTGHAGTEYLYRHHSNNMPVASTAASFLGQMLDPQRKKKIKAPVKKPTKQNNNDNNNNNDDENTNPEDVNGENNNLDN